MGPEVLGGKRRLQEKDVWRAGTALKKPPKPFVLVFDRHDESGQPAAIHPKTKELVTTCFNGVQFAPSDVTESFLCHCIDSGVGKGKVIIKRREPNPNYRTENPRKAEKVHA